MTESIFPQAQQIVDFWTKAAKANAATLESVIDTSFQATKATFGFATQMSEQWGKLAADAVKRVTDSTKSV